MTIGFSGLVLSDLQTPLNGTGKFRETSLLVMNFTGRPRNRPWKMRPSPCASYSDTSQKNTLVTMTKFAWNTMMPCASKAFNVISRSLIVCFKFWSIVFNITMYYSPFNNKASITMTIKLHFSCFNAGIIPFALLITIVTHYKAISYRNF
jgi:hypothetical protein